MEGATTTLKDQLEQLLRVAAEVSVALDRAEGPLMGVPHYAIIEARAHELGQQLSRPIQARQMGEITAQAAPPRSAPRAALVVKPDPRIVGGLPLTAPSRCRSPWVTVPTVVGTFSPLRETLGFDARELTPLWGQRRTVAAAAARSFQRAAIVMKQVGGPSVSAKTIERVVHDVGRELAERRDADPKTDDALASGPESPPDLAVVECDGGRIRTWEPGHGPGVHRTAEGGGRPRTPA